jgi:hypothetical protein
MLLETQGPTVIKLLARERGTNTKRAGLSNGAKTAREELLLLRFVGRQICVMPALICPARTEERELLPTDLAQSA